MDTAAAAATSSSLSMCVSALHLLTQIESDCSRRYAEQTAGRGGGGGLLVPIEKKERVGLSEWNAIYKAEKTKYKILERWRLCKDESLLKGRT
jgi:hypothetical protein